MVIVHNRLIDTLVGLFMLAGLAGLLIFAFIVSGLTQLRNGDSYSLTADFDDVGSLKPRAAVSIGGVTVGRVKSITLNSNTYRAQVVMDIEKRFNQIPVDSTASIFTQGLLGANYIHLEPGLDTNSLKPNGKIETTHSALILENLIGQLLYSFKSKDDSKSSSANADSDKL